jgi:hypothetical protein
LSVGGILRRYGAAFLRQYPQTPMGVQRVLARLAACRTQALGGHVTRCSQCGDVRYRYHSCGDRHCPSCGGSKRAAWLERRRAELLPVSYFHVVFTLPHQLSALVLGHRRLLYPLLLRAAAQTLLDVAADPGQLGVRLGALLVLHTWGQQLEHHAHVHAVVPGGGLSVDGSRWQSCRRNFLLPVKVLGAVFRGKYLEGLRQLHDRGELRCGGSVAALAEPSAFHAWLATLYRTPWVVYAKPPFGDDPEQVLKYLARYTHRVALSNSRLLRLVNDQVTLSYKDYADGCRIKELTLPAVEFVRRFALHVVPGGLVRIRQYGLLANRGRSKRLEHCRQLLPAAPAPTAVAAAAPSPLATAAAPTETNSERPRPFLSSGCLVMLLSLLVYGLPPLPAAGLQPPSTELGSPQAPRCLACGLGRLETLWQAPRPRPQDLPALSFWQPWPEDTS